MILTKSIQPDDYSLIGIEVQALQVAAQELSKHGLTIEIGHTHRMWEYGMALAALQRWDMMQGGRSASTLKILDVGAGNGLLGPTLALVYHVGIDELEPNIECYATRIELCKYLASKKVPEINWINGYLGQQPDPMKKWDVVFCISVVEHVPQAVETRFWQNIADCVADGGLLFMTTDVMPASSGRYVFDNLRATNYTVDTIRDRMWYLYERGFRHFNETDFSYQGAQVHDYSFFSMALVKG